MSPRLSILIATIGRRNDRFLSLLADLMNQADRHGDAIEIVAYWNNGERPIGRIRQALLEEAKGEYVCFIDDDDRVPSFYCSRILKALGEDYVGFKVKLFNDGVEMPPVYHSLRYDHWHQDDLGYYRNVTHLNPVRRSIALKARFYSKGAGEDEGWAKAVAPFVKTENYIDGFMYFYQHDRADTSFGGAYRRKQPHTRPDVQHRTFRWHPDSKLTSEGT